MDIKLLGQTFVINVTKEKEAFYKAVASELDKNLHEVLEKARLKSDVRAALQVAFSIACENATLKEAALNGSSDEAFKLQQISSRLDSCIEKLKSIE